MPKKPQTNRQTETQLPTASPKRDYRRSDEKRMASPALAKAKRLRSTRRWQLLRHRILSYQPLCQNPFKIAHHAVWATEVHHIQGLADRPDLAFRASNLTTLCHWCHARIEAMERKGQDTSLLFQDLVYEYLPKGGGGCTS